MRHILTYLYNGNSIEYIADNYNLSQEAIKDAIAFAQDVYDDAIGSAAYPYDDDYECDGTDCPPRAHDHKVKP